MSQPRTTISIAKDRADQLKQLAAQAGVPVTAYLEQTIRKDALRASIRPPETLISFSKDDPSQILLKFDRANNGRPMPLTVLTHKEAAQLAWTLQRPPEQLPGCPAIPVSADEGLIEISKHSRAVVFHHYTADGSSFMRTMSHDIAADVGQWLLAAVEHAKKAQRVSNRPHH